jgi:mannose-6-phosphate isomerase-like protein (cupin superfamily)
MSADAPTPEEETMHIARNDPAKPAKAWYTELAQPDLPFVGFANEGVNERHYHRQAFEIYLVARGSSTVVVDDATVVLQPGDALVVEPGEVHTFVHNTPDYFHFVVQWPAVGDDKVRVP